MLMYQQAYTSSSATVNFVFVHTEYINGHRLCILLNCSDFVCTKKKDNAKQ